MIDFILLCYFLYGLFYSGRMFDKICDFLIPEDRSLDKYDVILVFLSTILCILLWPLVLGANKIKSDT